MARVPQLRILTKACEPGLLCYIPAANPMPSRAGSLGVRASQPTGLTMAHAPQTQESAELASHRRGWQFFLQFSKWFALHVLAIVFLLIFTLVGHAPFIPTLVLLLAAVLILGSIFH